MKMAVIGCGLIGGSMALSWKRAGIVDEVIAFGHNPATLQKALDKGAADTVTTSILSSPLRLSKMRTSLSAPFPWRRWNPFLRKWLRSLSLMPWLLMSDLPVKP
jgi:glycine/D-amino acid oxidase-like deaminating enzyme